MRPNTPHFVVTPSAAICHGGHFYAMSCIRDTIYGLFHMFCISKAITNTEHQQDSRLLIRRLIIHTHHLLVKGNADIHPLSSLPAHVPDVCTLKGTLDLFLLCIFAELGELLDPRAYRKQFRNDVDLECDRLHTIQVRGLARELVAWWSARFVFFTPAEGVVLGQTMFT